MAVPKPQLYLSSALAPEYPICTDLLLNTFEHYIYVIFICLQIYMFSI